MTFFPYPQSGSRGLLPPYLLGGEGGRRCQAWPATTTLFHLPPHFTHCLHSAPPSRDPQCLVIPSAWPGASPRANWAEAEGQSVRSLLHRSSVFTMVCVCLFLLLPNMLRFSSPYLCSTPPAFPLMTLLCPMNAASRNL